MHGGPHGFVGPGVTQTHLYRWVAALRGWTVLSLDPSGSGTYGDAHTRRIRSRWGTIDLEETVAAVEELVAGRMADRSSIAVAGYSYGGFLAAHALARARIFRCGVIGAPVANLQSWYATSDVGAYFLGWHYRRRRPRFWQRMGDASPTTGAARISVPTLILQGAFDRRCPPSQADELLAAISAKTPGIARLVRYPRATHSFPGSGIPSHRLDYHARVVTFVEGVLARERHEAG
jgi:dipeptidyl aminopeptidase/acylaminoacyl peptidase